MLIAMPNSYHASAVRRENGLYWALTMERRAAIG